MKKNTKKVTLLLPLLLLSSCSLEVAFLPYKHCITDTDTCALIETDDYYKLGAYAKSYQDVLRSNTNGNSRIVPLNSSGQQKILVLPVNFPDFDLNELDKNNGETAHIHLQNAFFGENRTTRFYSVAGYYEASSYGKLKLSGTVAPWYTLPAEYSVSAIKSRVRSNSDKLNETAEILNLALLEYAKTNDLSAFDLDNNGVVDSVYVIYSYPFEPKDVNNIFWAFAANMNKKEPALTHQANAYSWSSYYYLDVGRNKKPDPHTYIHEVGHLLGLPDYYNTNYDDPYSPLGGFDMMDYTLGDHTGLSKMLLDWARPYAIKQSTTLNLRPFSETGDLLLLKNSWNEKAVDEYILLEYYTPTVLNELDSTLNASFKLPKTNGIKVYHVDARTVYEVKNGSVVRYPYVNTYEGEFGGTELLAHSNSTGSYNNAPVKTNKLYTLLEPRESTNINGLFKQANKDSLFQKGDEFGYEYFTSFTFNDNTPLNFRFKIIQLTNAYATIEVEVF
ncbi:MAG: Immune inhibitor A peptidase M6 [Tenericutes bacterium ADurb.Bin087]|nr:MAG: Immune inhibitor A peptidase M6 [Tenericutes bacterium ADurb.Bin087]